MGNKNTKFFDDLSKGATWSAGVAFKRSNPLPLDRYSVFETKALAEAYATSNAVAYPGQVIAVAEGNKMVAYVLAENTAGDALVLQQIGIIPTGDDKTIDVTEDGVISLLAADTEVFKKDAEGNPTEEKEINAGAQLILQADGTLKWVKPDTTTVEGLSTAVEDLKGKMTTAETDIDALEAKVGKATEGETAATGLYALIDAETARATTAEETLDTAVKAAQKTADDTKARVDAFLDGEGLADTIDSLKDIQNELEALTDATELANAIAVKADKVTGAVAGNFAGLDANGNLTDSGKKASDFATPAEVKAVDDKLANYYTKEEIAGLNHATKGELEAEATTARAAEKANADAITAIKADATIVTFKGVEEALAGKQATGDYATKTEAKGYADAKDTAISAAQGKADSAYALAEGAQSAAEAAQGTANTNAANIEELDKLLYGREAVEGQDAIVGLNTKVASNTTRISTLEGTVAGHTTAIGENATAAANAQAQADEALRVANTKTTIAEVEAKGYAVAETVNAEIAKKTTMAEVEAKGYAVAETVNTDLAKKADKETTYTKTEVDGLIAPLATTEALNGVKATAEQGVSDAAAAKEVADAAKARIDGFIDGTAEAESAIDTLIEIQQYMTADTEAFTQLSNKVTNIENGTTTVPKATDADTVDGKHASDFEVAGAAAGALAEAKEYADAINTGVMKVESLTDLLIVTTDENGNVKIALPNEIIFNGGGANV